MNACSGMMSRIDCARYLAYSTVCFLYRLVSHAMLTTIIHTTIAFLFLLRLPLTLLLLPYAITATLIPFRLIPSTNPYSSSSTPHLPFPPPTVHLYYNYNSHHLILYTFPSSPSSAVHILHSDPRSTPCSNILISLTFSFSFYCTHSAF